MLLLVIWNCVALVFQVQSSISNMLESISNMLESMFTNLFLSEHKIVILITDHKSIYICAGQGLK